MALGRGTIEICTDRELLMLALERILAGRFQCERCSPECIIAVHRADGGDWPAAIVVDLSHQPLRTDSGAAGVLNDVSNADDVLACLEAVTSGRRWVLPSMTEAVLSTRRCHLSRREGQLVKLIARGLRNNEIAFALSITEGTVKVYLSRLFSKVGVSGRYELALLGLRHNGNESADRASAEEVGVEAGFAPLESVYVHRDVPPPRPN